MAYKDVCCAVQGVKDIRCSIGSVMLCWNGALPVYRLAESFK